MQALAVDSYFDTYRGVVTYVRVFSGLLKKGLRVKLLHSDKSYEIKEVGSFNRSLTPDQNLVPEKPATSPPTSRRRRK